MDISNPQTQKQTQEQQLKTVQCPICENYFKIDLSGLEIGDIVECPVCGGTSELVDEQGSLEPVVKGK
ncbi:MAG: hypothetical protein ACUVQT_09875 [bacterium]